MPKTILYAVMWMLAASTFGMVAPAIAATTTIALPALLGKYQSYPYIDPNWGVDYRATTFTVPESVASIEEMSLVLTGTWTEGVISCEPGPYEFTSGPEIWVVLTVPEGCFAAYIVPPDGEFENWSAAFEPCHPPGDLDLNMLLGQEIPVEIRPLLWIFGLCEVAVDSYGTLTDVRLVVRGSVPVAAASWTAVKALYR
jgi:hypothetical protein